MKRLALVAAALVAVARLAATPAASWQTAQPFVGVTYSERVETQPRPLRMHVAQIDLEAPGIRFKVSSPAGDREVMRQSTLDFLKQERAQLAINAHYFLPFLIVSVHLLVVVQVVETRALAQWVASKVAHAQ